MFSALISVSEEVIDFARHNINGIKSFILLFVLLIGMSRLYLSVELSQMRLVLKKL